MAIIRQRAVVAIPVCNEAETIAACLTALARQTGPRPDRIVLLLNNCTDGTAAKLRGIAPALGIPCNGIERKLYGAAANAGTARRLAMREAACGLAESDILLTTDADGQVAPDWLAANLTAFRNGADAVCGRAAIEPSAAANLPRHLREDDARECRLLALNDEIASLLDPDPADPWPRHTEHSGASIAVTAAAWRACGGIPALPCGEDRAFIANLRRIDAKIRHTPFARVTVSARQHGRARGGMADTIRRRIVCQDEFADESAEPAANACRRAILRARTRAVWAGRTQYHLLAKSLALPPRLVRGALDQPYFGAAWAALEAASPDLVRLPVRFTELVAEIAQAEALLARLRGTEANAASAAMA